MGTVGFEPQDGKAPGGSFDFDVQRSNRCSLRPAFGDAHRRGPRGSACPSSTAQAALMFVQACATISHQDHGAKARSEAAAGDGPGRGTTGRE